MVRESWRWVFWLALGAGLIFGLVLNPWLLILTAGLMIWYCAPLIVAGELTAEEDAESHVLHEASERKQ